MTRRTRSKVLPAVRPNAGLEREYQRRLEAIVDEMAGSLLWWVRAQYRKTPPWMARDAAAQTARTPAAKLNTKLDELGDQWLKRFDEAAPKLADWFSQKVQKRSDVRLRQILRDGGLSVEFQATPAARDIARATAEYSTSLIKSIAAEHLTDVAGIVNRNIQAGGNIGGLVKDLQAQYGVTRRRAALIAKTENSRATAAFTRQRQIEVGVKEAEWLHSAGGRKPRPSHVAFSRKRYDIETGAFLDGVWTFPGVEIGCRCVSKTVLSGFAK